VGQRSQNTGEDRGYRIDSGKDLWKRYSLKKAGRQYQVIVTLDDKEVGKLFIDLTEPALNHAVFGFEDGSLRCFFPGSTMDIRADRPPHLVALSTNVHQNAGVGIYLSGPGLKTRPVQFKVPLVPDTKAAGYQLIVRRGEMTLGFIDINPLIGNE